MANEQRKTLPHSLIVQRQLVHYLADGELCSGQWLGEQLGISRTAVAKHLEQLQHHGLDLYKIKGKGYRLASALQLLDAQRIKLYQQAGMPDILLQHVTDSTNSQLMKKLQDGQPLQKVGPSPLFCLKGKRDEKEKYKRNEQGPESKRYAMQGKF